MSGADRASFAAIVADRNSLQKHVWRAPIILATAEGCGRAEIMRHARVSKPCVWCWRGAYRGDRRAGTRHDGQSGRHQRPVRCNASIARMGCKPLGCASSSCRGSAVRRQAAEIIGRYVDLPAHAVVFSVDETSQIQALDPMQPGRRRTGQALISTQ